MQGWYDKNIHDRHVTLWDLGENDENFSDDDAEGVTLSVQVTIFSENDEVELAREIKSLIVEVEQVEKEASAFDDYDRENGYEDEDEQPEENQWKVCGEIVDRVVKIAIRLLKNSYSQCMKENIVTLLDYLKFELDTINENQ